MTCDTNERQDEYTADRVMRSDAVDAMRRSSQTANKFGRCGNRAKNESQNCDTSLATGEWALGSRARGKLAKRPPDVTVSATRAAGSPICDLPFLKAAAAVPRRLYTRTLRSVENSMKIRLLKL